MRRRSMPRRMAVGDSVSVQGVCLTVTRLDGPVFMPMYREKRSPRRRSGSLSRGAA